MSRPPNDLTPLPDLLHGAPLAGPVRTRRPVYTDLLPPCNAACPAGENIQAYLASARAGEHERAWRQLTADNPFPAIHGRVCYHPCEDSCNRAELDSSVSIHSVERFLGDLALDRGWRFDPPPARTGKRVLIIGAGPSGLSAAYHLARRGHEVEIRDAGAEPGGMMRYGIPAYRLPRDVLAGELARIEALGVRITCGHRVTDLAAEQATGRFDAAFVAVGAHLSKHVDIPARDASRIIDAVPFLRDVAAGERPAVGRRVAVYGGGNTAMDAARVARRLGAQDTMIVYRRTRAQMPAHAEEAADAEREGVRINWLRTIAALPAGRRGRGDDDIVAAAARPGSCGGAAGRAGGLDGTQGNRRYRGRSADCSPRRPTSPSPATGGAATSASSSVSAGPTRPGDARQVPPKIGRRFSAKAVRPSR